MPRQTTPLIEEIARALATNRGSKVVQAAHRSDARAILPIIEREIDRRAGDYIDIPRLTLGKQ